MPPCGGRGLVGVSFNEAPAKGGGEWPAPAGPSACGTRFNEAPAKGGGEYPHGLGSMAPVG